MRFNVVTTSHFEKLVVKLEKKYRTIRKDILSVVINLEKGELEGKSIPGFHNKIYKARIKSQDIQKGKSGGYRLIYLIKKKEARIYLLSIYIKSQQENISSIEINNIMKEQYLSLQ